MADKKNILITGGSGLVGKELTQLLLAEGHTVSHLSRKANNNPLVTTYLWDVKNGEIDEKCLNGIDTIVHLAGAGIAGKRWSASRKKELIDSRVKSIELIYRLMKSKPNQVKSVISASASGYYSNRGDELLTETSPPAHDFLGVCCIVWENAVDEGEAMGLRVLKYRTGVVLSKNGGALPQLARPVKFNVGSPLGDGKQWVPWVHHQDVCDMYLHGINNQELKGVFNMAAPNPVTNAQLTQAVARQFKKNLWAPKVPAFLIRLLFGEMAIVVLGSTKLSDTKITATGFTFKYPDVASALKEIYG